MASSLRSSCQGLPRSLDLLSPCKGPSYRGFANSRGPRWRGRTDRSVAMGGWVEWGGGRLSAQRSLNTRWAQGPGTTGITHVSCWRPFEIPSVLCRCRAVATLMSCSVGHPKSDAVREVPGVLAECLVAVAECLVAESASCFPVAPSTTTAPHGVTLACARLSGGLS